MDFDDHARIAGDEAVRAAIVGAAPVICATPYQWIDPADIEPRPWLIGHWYMRGTVTAIVAPGGFGKTTLLCGTAISGVTGRAFLGKTVFDGKLRVWIWNLEDPLRELQMSLQAAAMHWTVKREDVEGRLFVDTAMDVEEKRLCTATEHNGEFKIIEPVMAAITAELVRRKIDLLIIDPFVSSHEIDENANSKIDKVTKRWGRVAMAANCSIGLVHHTKKVAGQKIGLEAARGGVALVYASRAALVLNRMDEAEATQFGIGKDEADRRRYVSVMDDKHNRTPAMKADWFHLYSVDLGNRGAGVPGDSLGVAVPWIPPDAFEGVTTDHLLRVQLLIAEGGYKAHHSADDWAGYAVAEVFGLDLTDKADKARILAMLKTWQANSAFKVEEKLDKNRQWKKFLLVDQWANAAPATPSESVASHGVAVERPSATLHPPPFGGGGVAAVAGGDIQVSHSGDGPEPWSDPADEFLSDRRPRF